MEDLFPRKEGVEFLRLRTTQEGSYSITRRRDAERIMNVLRHNLPKLDTLEFTDATACIGGDTINFALACKHVHSIELKKENYEVLKNNVEVYGLTNVNIYQGDATQFFDWQTDVLYIDPPWGGREYRSQKSLDLFLSNKRLDIWLEEILLRKNRPSFILLKLPYNFNFKRFDKLSNVEDIRPFQIRSYILILIRVHKFNPKQNP